MNSTKKNNIASTPPNGICAKTYGKVTNTRPGPWLGEMPNENTAGMIATPARIANSVSAIAVCTDIFTTFSPLFTYEAYVKMMPKPTLKEKNAWPRASRKVFAVTFEKSGLKRKSSPAPAPGRVTERTAITTTIRNSSGISTLEYLSMPSFTPANNIAPDSPANKAI